ncbi:LacI family DNA-binding transcriptional regulator [Promicromonospora thailandica]|uniref:Transcriptional regulator, LacI family n=1 Tax=Promicromonospora thailandica TaxID=765201 RepID=A0A9X2G6Q1_9MICO|nr:LacI family DNA-binding transcriptional regulator [Promicromonospora thailandica]MCP2266593.1 transcriptional regulator, LacI family [Promicromonospora thailandica]
MRKHTAGLRLVDVAERAGVSIATASRALSGSAGVSEVLAERVRAVAADLGYVANVHARSLASGASPGVGLVVHEIGDPYFAEIASGVLEVAGAHDRMVQICHTGRDPYAEVAQLRALVNARVGIIVVAGSGHLDRDVQARMKVEVHAFEAAGGRVAVIGRHPQLGVDAVVPANVEGGRAIAEHLLGLGHRRIAVAAGSRRLATMADRLTGVSRALEAHGLRLADLPVVEAEFTLEGGKEAARRILDEHPDVTAVLALNDDMAVGVLSVLRERGISVPDDVSVTGFDDVTVAGHLSPALTTVHLPMKEMGRQALELALLPRATRPRRRPAAQRLMVRASTSRAR